MSPRFINTTTVNSKKCPVKKLPLSMATLLLVTSIWRGKRNANASESDVTKSMVDWAISNMTWDVNPRASVFSAGGAPTGRVISLYLDGFFMGPLGVNTIDVRRGSMLHTNVLHNLVYLKCVNWIKGLEIMRLQNSSESLDSSPDRSSSSSEASSSDCSSSS